MTFKGLSLILFLTFPVLAAHAQETDFSRLKEGLDANALPLVNIVTESALKNDSYVSGQIEISDFQKRTDPARRDVQFRCEVKYRGASAMAYDKKSLAVKLVDSRGDDLDANVLGIREENSWIHRGGKYSGDGIGYALSGDIRRRAVDGLVKTARGLVSRSGGKHTDRAGYLTCLVGEYIAEHI